MDEAGGNEIKSFNITYFIPEVSSKQEFTKADHVVKYKDVVCN